MTQFRRFALPVVFSLVAASCGQRGPSGDAGQTAAPVPAATEHDLTVCTFPSVRPTYLPWVPGGSPIPEPQKELLGPELQKGQEPTPSYAILMWSKTVTQDRHFQVSLWTTWQHGQVESDERVDVAINGSPGYMHAHRGGSPSTAVISWDIGTQKCSVVHLVLRAPPLPLNEVKREVIKIAESLRRT